MQALGVPSTELLSATPPGGHPAVSPSQKLPAAGATSARSSWPVRSLRLDTVSPLAALDQPLSRHSSDDSDNNGSGSFRDTSVRCGLVLLPLLSSAGSAWAGGRWRAVLCSRYLAGLPAHQLRLDSHLTKADSDNLAAQPNSGADSNGKGVVSDTESSSSCDASRLEHGVAVDFSTARGDTALMAMWLAARVARAHTCLQRLQRLATATSCVPDFSAQHSSKPNPSAHDRDGKLLSSSKSEVEEDVKPRLQDVSRVSAERGGIGLGVKGSSCAVFRLPGRPAVSIEAASLTTLLLIVQLASAAESGPAAAESAPAAVEVSDMPSAAQQRAGVQGSEGQHTQQLLVIELRWEQPSWDRDRSQAAKHDAPMAPIDAVPEAISGGHAGGGNDISGGARCHASAYILSPPFASSATATGQLSSLLKDSRAGASQHHAVVICMLNVCSLLQLSETSVRYSACPTARGNPALRDRTGSSSNNTLDHTA